MLFEQLRIEDQTLNLHHFVTAHPIFKPDTWARFFNKAEHELCGSSAQVALKLKKLKQAQYVAYS